MKHGTWVCVVTAILMAAVVVGRGDPRPSLDEIAAAPLDAEYVAKILEAMNQKQVDTAPLISAVLLQGGGGAVADVAGIKDASQTEGGVLAHFKRNWGKYTVGSVSAAGLWYANHRDFWQGDSSQSTPPSVTYNVTAGRDVTIGDGNTTGNSEAAAAEE